MSGKQMTLNEKNAATVRGEALAAHLLASAALQAVFSFINYKEQTLSGIKAITDDKLNRIGAAKGDGEDEFNTQMRETARNVIDQTLAAIARGLTSGPGPKQ